MSDDIVLPPPSSVKPKLGMKRDAEAIRLRALGWSTTEITRQLDFADDVHTVAAMRRALTNYVRFGNDEHRQLELNSLDELESVLWKQLRKSHTLVSHGRVVIDPDSGDTMPDERYALEVVDRIIRIKERRAKLLGLDAPVKAQVITIDSVDAEIARLELELELNGHHRFSDDAV